MPRVLVAWLMQPAAIMSANPLRRIQSFGQSVWLDHLDRHMIQSGKLSRLIEEDGLGGITTNPKILHDAISKGDEYRDAIQRLRAEGKNPKEMYEALAIEDVQAAADLLARSSDRATGEAGFVSLEVDPRVSFDVEATISEAKRLWHALDRKNVMIKIPGTHEGVRALSTLIADGVNINVTLLFGVPRYRSVAEAYLTGLEHRQARGLPISHVRSVASFFLSRIDTMVDEMLEARGAAARELRGKAAIASAEAAYRVLSEVLDGPRYTALQNHAARPQRLLWASTSTKNPNYAELKYVEPLIGPNTVTTLTPKTLAAYRKQGDPAAMLGHGGTGQVFSRLLDQGVDIHDVANRLEREGITKFERPLAELLDWLRSSKA
jgi:transaldolase